LINLPAKTKILKRASVFNKDTKKEAFEFFTKDKEYLNSKLKEDVKENIFFRNYEDYLTSVFLEEKENFQRFKPITLQKAFSSKMLLELFKENLNSTPIEKRAKKVVVFDTETTDIAGYIVSYAFVLYNLETKQIEEEIAHIGTPFDIPFGGIYLGCVNLFRREL
jgi:DNA polymerase-3 subunit epsilon